MLGSSVAVTFLPIACVVVPRVRRDAGVPCTACAQRACAGTLGRSTGKGKPYTALCALCVINCYPAPLGGIQVIRAPLASLMHPPSLSLHMQPTAPLCRTRRTHQRKLPQQPDRQRRAEGRREDGQSRMLHWFPPHPSRHSHPATLPTSTCKSGLELLGTGRPN